MRTAARRIALLTVLSIVPLALTLASPASAACPCMLFSSVARPSLSGASVQDLLYPLPSLELGVKVTVDAPMSLSAFRFYKDPLETGAHEARLWTSNGLLIAQAAFESETDSGWQRQALSKPIELQAGSVYVVSVNANTAYGLTTWGLVAPVSSGPLRTIADGANGVYAETAGEFPNSTYRSSNYFVDLEVVPSGPGPVVTAFTPAAGSTVDEEETELTATFSTAMDPATINASSFTLRRPDGIPMPATVSYDSSARRATLTTTYPLALATNYTARLEKTIAALDAQPLSAAVTWRVSTKPLRINAGGPAMDTFDEDRDFSGGQLWSSGMTVLAASDESVYRDERWGQFTYSIPVPNGTYDVRLDFVELYYGTAVSGGCAGKRVFGMDVLDTAAAPDIAGLDICSQVGPNAALVKTIPGVAVSDGSLDIASVYGSADDPEVAAIEILAAGSPLPPPPPAPAPPPVLTTARIDAGGAGLTTVGGTVFEADRLFTGGDVFSSALSIAGTWDDRLYQTERWGQFDYAIPVTNGVYDVRLHFVELYYGTWTRSCSGKRVFGIDILDTSGVDIPPWFDICGQVGPQAALVKTIRGVAVTDGELNVHSIYGKADDPEIAAIEVVPAS